MTERRFAFLGLLLLVGCDGAFRTADQRGQNAFDAGRYAEAAEVFVEPMHRGVALFRAGEFEAAAAAFVAVGGPDGAFNRGNALVMRGLYDDAIDSYDRALAWRPGWKPAEDNRAIAVARRDALAPPDDAGPGTGGKLEADEIVVGDRKMSENADTVEAGAGERFSDEELQSLRLRREVRTDDAQHRGMHPGETHHSPASRTAFW